MLMKLFLTILNPVIIMLRDSYPFYQTPRPDDLTVDSNFEVNLILSFIDKNIRVFQITII